MLRYLRKRVYIERSASCQRRTLIYLDGFVTYILLYSELTETMVSTTPVSATTTLTTSTPVMACGAPPSVAAATVAYNDTVATFTCISGYSLAGSNQIVCSGSTWTGNSPTCTYLTQADDIDTNVNVYNSDMPDWLLGVLAALGCAVALLILTCIVCCCMYMCGCVSGPLGSGANAVHPLNTRGSPCCCCNQRRRRRRRGDDFYDSRSSSVVDMRNGHKNDQEVRIAGFNYSKSKKGYPKVANNNNKMFHHVKHQY
ncbi:uncharacterized protein LOC110454594 isoform X2 [Mizuhopecten yessoensis]|uniref:uncharacterized protein LOC110454594 isoform X2 n=1 Tax=Mizuhopecten yessoensis TaxID=6573 RepID=UPI000B45C719|nr:uncharacterized protein LOC110454594 isoform X2 [Mizuhopecten yessoensis]